MVLQLNRVSKSFGGIKAVQGVSFTVKEGAMVGIIGPNGSGKTTVFNLIGGILKPDSGQILLNGDNIAGLPPFEVSRRGLARTFQISRPFPDLTVVENVMVPLLSRKKSLHFARSRATELIELVGLYQIRNEKPRHINTISWRMLELARALATEPRLLLLDEVMAGLTEAECDKIVGVIQRLNQEDGITIVIVEHVMRVIMQLVEWIIVLHEGQKIAEGYPNEIRVSPVVVEAYLGKGSYYAPC